MSCLCPLSTIIYLMPRVKVWEIVIENEECIMHNFRAMCLLQPHSCFFATREFELYLYKITIESMTRIYLIPTILVLLLAVGCHHADSNWQHFFIRRYYI